MDAATYVLYTNKSYAQPGELCPGSKECVRLCKGRADVLVQDVDAILRSGVDLPPWLDGTPTVVDMKTSQAAKGAAAIQMLEKLPAAGGGGGAAAPVAKPSYSDDKISSADMEALIKQRANDAPAATDNRPPPAPVSDA